MKQQALPLKLDNISDTQIPIISSSNYEAYEAVNNWQDWRDCTLYLYGNSGVGKRFLVDYFRAISGASEVERAAGYSFPDYPQNLYLISPEKHDEKALFHIINHVRQQKGRLLIIAEKSAGVINVSLNDLSSRLRAMQSVEVNQPDDDFLVQAASKILCDRQIRLSDESLNYLLLNIERDINTLFRTINRLDAAALDEHRNITVPFIRKILQEV
jgi:chromosomal replication initiation ATPase DnaA